MPAAERSVSLRADGVSKRHGGCAIRIIFRRGGSWPGSRSRGRWSRQAGLGDEPRKVFAELSEIALVDVALPTRNGVTLRKRCIGQPNQHQLVLLQYLGLRLPSVPEFALV